MTYTQKLHLSIHQINFTAYLYGDGNAWDNKKAKTLRKQFPRGKVQQRLEALELKSLLYRLSEELDTIKAASGGILAYSCAE